MTYRFTPPFLAFALLLAAGASLVLFWIHADSRSAAVRPFTLLSYNVQTLFDGHDHGGEYERFRSAAGWDRERYYDRLVRTELAVRSASAAFPGGRLPDVLVFQELESAGVARDLARDFLRGYRHIAAGRAGVTSTQVVVLSRRRPTLLRAHAATVVRDLPSGRAAGAGRMPGAGSPRGASARPWARPPSHATIWRSRDLVELRFTRPELTVLAAHWKSQSGGERATEYLRRLEAALAVSLARSTSISLARSPPVLLVGDLNEDLQEYRQHDGAYLTALLPQEAGSVAAHGGVPAGGSLRFTVPGSSFAGTHLGGMPVFRSLWGPESGTGTYFYRGRWERLDQAFLLAGPEWEGSLRVARGGDLVDDEGRPRRYDVRTNRGLSDHLPVAVTLTRRRSP